MPALPVIKYFKYVPLPVLGMQHFRLCLILNQNDYTRLFTLLDFARLLFDLTGYLDLFQSLAARHAG